MVQQLSALRVTADFDASGYQRGAQAKVAADNAMSASSRQVGSALAQQDAAVGNSGGILGRLSRQYVDGYGSAAKFEAAVRSLQRGVETGNVPLDRAGLILQGLHAKYGLMADAAAIAAKGNADLAGVVERTNAHLRNTVPHADVAGKSIGAVGAQMQNLRAQVFDVAQTLATSNPLTILTQQGPQIYQALDGPGGVRAGLQNVIGSVRGLVTPATAAGAALIAAAVGGALAWSRFDDQQKLVQSTLQGLGARVGLTSQQFMAMSQASAAANNLSVRQATDLGVAYARTGALGADNIQRLIGLTKNFAATMGTDVEGAKEQLTSLFADPASAIERLQKQFAFLDGQSRSTIESLLRQGEAQKAVAIALDKLPGSLANYNQSLGRISSAWEFLKGKISDADHAVGSFLDRLLRSSPVEERIAALERRIVALKQSSEAPPAPGSAPGGFVYDSFGGSASNRSTVPLPPRRPAELQSAERDLAMDRFSVARAWENEDGRKLTQDLVDRANAIRQMRKELSPLHDEQARLLAQETALRKAAESKDVEFQKQVVGIERWTDAARDMVEQAERAAHARKTMMTPENAAAEQREIDQLRATAKTDADRAAVAAREARLAQSGKMISGISAEADAQHRFNMVLLESSEATKRQIDEQKNAGQVLDLERKMIGASAAEREKAVAGLRAEQELTQRGVDLSSSLAQAYIAEAKANAVRRAEMEKARLASDLQYERDTVFLTGDERQIAQRLRPIYGNDSKAALKSAEADSIRTTAAISKGWGTAQSAVSDFATSFARDMQTGVKMADALANAAKNVGQQLTQAGISMGIRGLMSGNYVEAGIGGALAVGGIIASGSGPSEGRKQRLEQVKQAMAEQTRTMEEAQKQQVEAAQRAAEEAARAAEEAQRRAEQLARRRENFADRAFAAGLDTDTFAGRMAALERQFQREREEEWRQGGEAINDLLRAQAAERERLYRDENKRLLEQERQRYAEARQFLDQLARTIRQFVDGLKSGAQSPLSPAARLAEAQQQFNAQRALAAAGNRDALSGITTYAGNLIEAGKAFYASSQGFQDIFSAVTSQLEALPRLVTPEELIVNEISRQTSSLLTAFDALDLNGDQMISRQEAANTSLAKIFSELDVNGDGQISRLELIKGAAQGTQSNTTSALTYDYLILGAQNSGNGILNAISGQTNAVNNNTQTQINQAHTTHQLLQKIVFNTASHASKDGAAAQFAAGGWVRGPGTGTSDSIAARLSNGEFVVNAASARMFGPLLERMNRGSLGLPALPVPVGNDNSAAFGALIREVQALNRRIDHLEDALVRATVSGAEHVREGVDQVTEASQDLVRETKLQSLRRAA